MQTGGQARPSGPIVLLPADKNAPGEFRECYYSCFLSVTDGQTQHIKT